MNDSTRFAIVQQYGASPPEDRDQGGSDNPLLTDGASAPEVCGDLWRFLYPSALREKTEHAHVGFIMPGMGVFFDDTVFCF